MTAVLSEPVLILNRNYVAQDFVTARKAVNLLMQGRAEALDIEGEEPNRKYFTYDFESWKELSEFKAEFEREQHIWLRTVNRHIAVPSILRLTHYGEYRRRKVKLNRHNLFARDGFRCQYCGKKFKSSDLTLDHVIPKSRGGKLEWHNLVCACVACNTRKSARTPREAGMRLVREPKAPPYQFPIPRVQRASWAHFVDVAYWLTTLQE